MPSSLIEAGLASGAFAAQEGGATARRAIAARSDSDEGWR